MPGKPFQSKLNAHLEEIRSLRRSRKTWDEIATELNTRYGLTTSQSAVYEFLKRRTARAAPFGFDDPVAKQSEQNGGKTSAPEERAGEDSQSNGDETKAARESRREATLKKIHEKRTAQKAGEEERMDPAAVMKVLYPQLDTGKKI